MMPRQRAYSAFWLLLFIVCLTSGIVACGSSEQPKEIRIGLIEPLNGELAEMVGQPAVNAAMLAVQQVNNAGGLEVGGRKHVVTLVMADDQDNPQAAVEAARKLIVQDNVAAIVGAPFSRIAIPVAALAESQHIPMVTSTATNPEVTDGKRYIFRTIFTDHFQGQVIARFVFEDLGIRKAAVLYDIASAYNKGLAEFFKQQFEAAGGQVVAFETYTTGEEDFGGQLRRIKDCNPEALFLPNYTNEVPRQAQQARQMELNLLLIGGDSWGAIRASDRSAVEGGFFSATYALELDTDQNRAFIVAYRRAYKQMPTFNAAQTYDACGLVFQAIRSQGKAHPEAIRAGLADIKEYSGVTGTMWFQGSGDPIKSAVIMQVKNGYFVFYKSVNPLKR